LVLWGSGRITGSSSLFGPLLTEDLVRFGRRCQDATFAFCKNPGNTPKASKGQRYCWCVISKSRGRRASETSRGCRSARRGALRAEGDKCRGARWHKRRRIGEGAKVTRVIAGSILPVPDWPFGRDLALQRVGLPPARIGCARAHHAKADMLLPRTQVARVVSDQSADCQRAAVQLTRIGYGCQLSRTAMGGASDDHFQPAECWVSLRLPSAAV
jgi:hypothetical protein